MALPPGITPKTVTVGVASFFDGTLAAGTATITAPVNVIHTPSNRPIFSSQISKPFVDGEASFNLAPTDAPGLNRVDWTYKLNVVISGALVQPDPIYFTLPTAGADVVDLDSLVTVPSSAGTPISVDALIKPAGGTNGQAIVYSDGQLVWGDTAPAPTADAVRDQTALAKTMRQARRGINVAGAEFSSANVVWENPASFAFLAARGHRLVRIPLLWENIQPTLSGALNTTILGGLKTTIAAAEAAGIKVIIDIHNYTKYNGIAYGDTGSFTQADFVDLWRRLSLVFRDDPAVIGYGLMNEPRLLPTVGGVTGNVRWRQAQQAALNAIRDNDDPTCVMIGGYTASSLAGWFNATSGQPVPYITDPADNFRWEAHHYWDSNGGTYSISYAAEATANAGWGGGDPTLKKTLFELNQWIAWLRQYGQRGYIGEFGWPSSAGPFPADAASWDNIGAQYLTRIDQEGDLIWTTAWATGSRWSAGYELQYYTPTAGVLTTPLSNAATLEAHRERGLIGIGQQPTRSLTIQPADFSATWVGWSSDPTAIAGGTALPTTGALVATEIKLHKDTAVSSLTVLIGTAGAGGTTGQCFAGIYDSAGVQLATSADIATQITTTGYRTFSMTTPTAVLPAGTVLYGVLLVNATTQPQVGRTTSLGAALQSPMIRRYGLSGTAQTALPASFSPGSMAVAPAAFWMAVS